MDAERIAELRELVTGEIDSRFVIAARNALPKLLDEIERLQEEVEHLRTVEYINCKYKDGEYCSMEYE